MKPKVGDIVYSLNVGNSARNCEQKLTKCQVVKVGNKYFSVSPIEEGWKWETKFYINGWSEVTNYSSNHALYESEQEFLDEKESLEILKKIRNHFGNHGKCETQLDDLRKICALITK